MLHDHLALAVITLIGLIWALYKYMTWTAQRIDEKELYETDREKYIVEDHEEIWTKPDKKVS